MEYTSQQLLSDLQTRSHTYIVNKVRYLTNKSNYEDICNLLKSSVIQNENVFDEIFFNKICRNIKVIEFINSNVLTLTKKQINWIAQSKYIQNIPETREVFVNKYNVEDYKPKRLSINKLERKIRNNNLIVKDDEINRTMKIGINYANSDNESQKWLEIYLNEFKKVTEALLKDIYKLFKEDPATLLTLSADLNYTQQHNLSVEEQEVKVNGKVITVDLGNGNELPVLQLNYKRDDKERIEFVCKVDNNTKIKLKENEKGTGVFFISKFSKQSLYNNLVSPKYFTVNPSQKYSGEFYRGLKVGDLTEILSPVNIRETLGAKIAETVCSFLSKYYESISEIEKVYIDNKKFFEGNKAIDESIALEYPVLKPNNNIKAVYEYNSFITTYNQYINENVWQKSDDNDIKDKVRKLKVIKGVPSFPIVEKQQVRDYDRILKEIKDEYEKLKTKVANLNKDDINQIRLTEWLSRKSVNAGRIIQTYFKNRKDEFKEREFKQLDIPVERSVEIAFDLLNLIDSKIESAKDKDISGHKAIRELSDIYAQYISVASELVFPDKKSKEYNDFRIRFGTLTGLLKADPFDALKKEKHEISFSGFSSAGDDLKKGFALAFKEVDGKTKFYLIFNLKNNIHLKFTEEETEFKVIAYGAEEKPVIKSLKFENKEGTCILPLNFGTRIGRRYIYQNMSKQDEKELVSIKNGLVKFQNMRIIKETPAAKDKDPKYYCAIALLRKKQTLTSREYEYERIIGMDMGEKVPAVIGVINKENKILNFEYLRPEMNDKLTEIQQKKDSSQSIKGFVPERLTSKIKNTTKTLLEDIAILAMEKAITDRALLVTEDLPRGFGRGNQKGTYVWMRQYTKLNDLLILKGKQMGIVKSDKTVNYNQNGMFSKVPAGYTSKTSIQTGFILRSHYYWDLKKENINNLNEIVLLDALLETEYILNITDKTVIVIWKDRETKIKFNGTASELGSYYLTDIGKNKFDYLLEQIFEFKDKDTVERKKYIKSFVFNLLNPRKTQDTYTDIFTGKSVNADVQGAINIARGFLFSQSSYYKPRLDTEVRLRLWQDWYSENLTEVPENLFK